MNYMEETQFKEYFSVTPRNGIYKSKKYLGEGVKFVRMGDLFRSDFIDCDSEKYQMINLTDKEKESVLLENNDLLFSRTSIVASGVGKCAIVRCDSDSEMVFDSNQIRVRLDPVKATPLFFYYYFKSETGRNKLLSLSRGAAVTTITGKDIGDALIPKVSKKEQDKISNFIYEYDLLIENNIKRIDVLEEMAQSIYKEWFVNFRASYSKELRSLKKKIPDWSKKYLCDFVNFERGIEPGSKNYKSNFEPETTPFLRVGDLGSRNSSVFVQNKFLKGKVLRKNDIAVSMDGTVGRVAFGFYGGYSTGIRKLVITDDHINREFLYFLMKSDHIQNIIRAHAKGTTILHASESIKNMTFLLPDREIMNLFSKLVKPKMDLILKLKEQNEILTKTRDLLISKLVTGEVEVEIKA